MWPPVQVPEGVEPVSYRVVFIFAVGWVETEYWADMQSFVHFECSNPVGEADKRFNYFTTQVGFIIDPSPPSTDFGSCPYVVDIAFPIRLLDSSQCLEISRTKHQHHHIHTFLVRLYPRAQLF